MSPLVSPYPHLIHKYIFICNGNNCSYWASLDDILFPRKTIFRYITPTEAQYLFTKSDSPFHSWVMSLLQRPLEFKKTCPNYGDPDEWLKAIELYDKYLCLL